MKKALQFIKGLFKKKESEKDVKTWTVGKTKHQTFVYSFHPQSGVMRMETGTIYVEASTERQAKREIERIISKRLKKEVKFDPRQPKKQRRAGFN